MKPYDMFRSSYEIIFREFFIYFLVDVADIKNY